MDQLDAIACTPDGQKIYLIDKYTAPGAGTGMLAYYDVGTAAYVEMGEVRLGGEAGPLVPQIVLAAFSPSGDKLYAVSQTTNSLYEIDPAKADATYVGVITTAGETPVNVSGADIAFGADGTLYLWTNGSNSGAPVGLHTLTLPPVNGAVLATYLGPPASSPTPFFTGLAIRDNGYGDLIGSQTTDDTIVQVSKTNGSILASYPMKVNGAAYPYGFGDMTVGPLVFCTKTIGYWKNHSWDGRTISILGVTIDEEYGKQILRDARGNNFSMLFAQLIAAKLNVGGAPVIWDAEAFLESLEFAYPGRFVNVMGDELNYSSTFSSKSEKSAAAQHWAALDAFNNDYHCEN